MGAAAPEPEPDLAVRCRGLIKRYRDVTAVDGLDLEVRRGECLGLLGPNGAGKTTTVEMIEGLTRPDEGVVELFGRRWREGHDHRIRQRLGVQLQDVELPDRLTVEECTRLFRTFFPRGRTVDAAIGLVELEDKRKSRVSKLSGGQRQRLALALALVGQPDLLCLDEPTTGLDPQARLKVWEVVGDFQAEGGTVLLTTHYMEEAARLCDRVAIVDRGRIVAIDKPATLIAQLGADQIIELDLGEPSVDPGSFADVAGVNTVHAAPEGERGLVLGVSEVALALPALFAAVEDRGLHVHRLTTHEPTLEDVFVALTGRGLRDG